MSLGRRIRDSRKKLGWSQAELGGRLTPPRTSQAVSGWENGAYQPSADDLATIARLTDVNLTWLMTGIYPVDNSVDSQVASRGRMVPSMDWSRVDKFIGGQYIPEMAARSHFPCGPRSFHTVFTDRSMEPEICAGDGLIVDRDLKPAPSDLVMVQIGDVVLVRKYRPRDGHVELAPLNPDWPTTTVQILNDAVLIGVVVETARPRR